MCAPKTAARAHARAGGVHGAIGQLAVQLVTVRMQGVDDQLQLAALPATPVALQPERHSATRVLNM